MGISVITRESKGSPLNGVDHDYNIQNIVSAIEDVDTGHDHDGVNSKKISLENILLTAFYPLELLRANSEGTGIESSGKTIDDILNHFHDGVDTPKVLATDLNVTNLTASQLLRVKSDGTAIESSGKTIDDIFNVSFGHNHDGLNSRKVDLASLVTSIEVGKTLISDGQGVSYTQDLRTTASPTFEGINITGLSSTYLTYINNGALASTDIAYASGNYGIGISASATGGKVRIKSSGDMPSLVCYQSDTQGSNTPVFEVKDKNDGRRWLITGNFELIGYYGGIGLGGSPGALLNIFRISQIANNLVPLAIYPNASTIADAFCIYKKDGSDKSIVIDKDLKVGINSNSSNNYNLYVNGTLYASEGYKPGGGSWADSSDLRIKKTIEDADCSILYNLVKNLKLKYYSYIDEYADVIKDKHRIGWIADDVEKYFPKAITVQPLVVKKKVQVEREVEEPIYEEIEEDEIIFHDNVPVLTGNKIKKYVPKIEKRALRDADGNFVLDDEGRLIMVDTHITRKVLRVIEEEINEKILDDCKYVDETLVLRAMYGAIQVLINKVELLEKKLNS